MGPGKLFIIGGGSRPESMIKDLISLAEIQAQDAICIIPWASAEPDTAYFYAKMGFEEAGHRETLMLDSIEQAAQQLTNSKLIYITGGDQNRLMDVLKRHGLDQAILNAFDQGATIAGTSAGAAVMSAVMISGDQNKSPEYERTYSRIEAENAIYGRGLGLLESTIIDQHFVERSRYNRLITALHDYPGYGGIGVGESTAAVLNEHGLTVSGKGQVIVFYPLETWEKSETEKISAKGLTMDILEQGDTLNTIN